MPSGQAHLYSFTIVPAPGNRTSKAGNWLVPGLVEFPDSGGIRIPAAIVDSPLASICIGAPLALRWADAANVVVPVFEVRQ
jgi:hypothetical protein